MDVLLSWKDLLFVGLWHSSWQAAVLAGVVLLLQWLFGNRLSFGWRYSLWLIVVVRLALPLTPASRWSIFNAPVFEPLGFSTPTLLSDVGLSTPPVTKPSAAAPSKGFPASPEPQLRASQAVPTSFPTSQDSGLNAAAETILVWIPTLWILGVLFQVARICSQNVRFANRAKDRIAVMEPKLLGLLEECKGMMKIRLHITLFETPSVRSPALYGLFRPRLLLPQNLIESFSQHELRHVLLHELAHVKRSDMVINWLMTVLQTLHWFNPFVWLAFSRMRADRESACDALALTCANEADTRSYGATIIKLLEGFSRPATSPSLMGILEEKNRVQRRIRTIAHFRKPSRRSAWAVLLLVGFGLVGLTDARIPQPTLRTPSGNSLDVDPTVNDSAPPKEMPSTIHVVGKVIDETTKEPIANFQISVTEERRSESGSFTAKRLGLPGESTNGGFSLSFLQIWTIAYEIRIRADGYVPKRLGWHKYEEGDQSLVCPLAKGAPLEGVVHFPDGRPVAGAEVALRTDDSWVLFDQRGFINRGISLIARTDAEGRFAFKPELDPSKIHVVDERGYAEAKVDPKLALQRLTLVPWGRIEGTLLVGKKPGSGEMVKLGALPPLLAHVATTDNHGQFVFERVPPGEFVLSRQINSRLFDGPPVQVKSGETTHARFGGNGRMIVGRLTWPASERQIDWVSETYEVSFRSKSLVPSRVLPAHAQNFPVRLQSDGSFVVEDVPAGEYRLFAALRAIGADESAPFIADGRIRGTPAQSVRTNDPIAPTVRAVPLLPTRLPIAALETDVNVTAVLGNEQDSPLNIGTLAMRTLSSSISNAPVPSQRADRTDKRAQ